MGLGYMEMLASAHGSGTNRVSFTTAVSILPSQALHTIAPDDWHEGAGLWIRAAGEVSNIVTSQPTFTYTVNFGATNIWTSGALLTTTTAHTTVPWFLDLMMTCTTIGASAAVMCQGIVTSRAFIASGATTDSVVFGTGAPMMAPITTPATVGTFNSNASQQIDLLAACSVSSASNAIRLHQYWLIDMG
jgi:hypothetical protein